MGEADERIFSRRPLAQEFGDDPVIVLGMPRSGSTYLSHLLSRFDGLYVFDDLYYIRELETLGVRGDIGGEQLTRINEFMSWQVKARIRHEKNFDRFNLSWEDVDRMRDAITEALNGSAVPWQLPLKEWLCRLATRHGARRWGYKAPQDYLSLGKIQAAFPSARIIHLIRDPRSVLASYKHVSGEDGSRWQYHPIAYALYWRNSCQKLAQSADASASRIMRVRFEDMVSDLPSVLVELAGFLQSNPPREIPAWAPNTSFASGRRRGLNALETAICQKVCGEWMNRLGYATQDVHPGVGDFMDVLFRTFTFTGYQAWRICRQPTARVAIRRLAAELIGAGRAATRGNA